MALHSHDGHRVRPSFAIMVLLLAGFAASCGSSLEGPTPAVDSVTVTATSLGQGGVLIIPASYTYNEFGGVVLRKDSGLMSMSVAVSSAREQSFGQLSIYLLSGAGNETYCAQNSPDSPTWRSLPAGWTTTYTVTGFQVYRLPCTVTGARVIFHKRDNIHLGLPPTFSETITEVTLPISFTIRQ
jgi:hypothetical protein